MENDTNKRSYSTKQLVIMALMCGVALLFSFFSFPIIPAAPFLKLDIALVPPTIVGIMFGSGPGILVGIACALGHALITGNWIGALMNCIIACSFILPVSMLHSFMLKRSSTPKSMKNILFPLCLGSISMIVLAIVANLFIDTYFYGMPFDVVLGLIVPAIIPFNAIKAVILSALIIVVDRSIATFKR